MKRGFWIGLIIVIVLGVTFVPKIIMATQDAISGTTAFRPSEILISFKPDAASTPQIRAILNSVQGKVITYQRAELGVAEWDPTAVGTRSFRSSSNLLHIKIPQEIDLEKAISILNRNPIVEYAEKNYIIHATMTIPNDDHFSKLWVLYNTTQSGGTMRSDIHAPEAWDIATTSPDIVVAVIDSGIDYDHVDLADNIWLNPGECGGGKEYNLNDDDGNGYVDDWHGWDFVDYDNDPMDEYYYEGRYHGTHVAGIIGAIGNNDSGVAGVTWDVQLMPLRILNWRGIGDTANAVRAVDYATENGAHLSNNSYGGGALSYSFLSALSRAQAAGKLFVAAAGNDTTNTDVTPYYPSGYGHSCILAVLSTTDTDAISGFSNYGHITVDIGAPGGENLEQASYNIFSTKYGQEFQYLCGTSMATPFVTGAAALAWGKLPKMTYSQLKARILDTADYVPDLANKCVSDGRLNVYNILYDAAVPNAPSNLSAECYSWQSVHLVWTDNSANEIGFELWRQKTGEQDYSLIGSTDRNFLQFTDTTAYGNIVTFYRARAFNMAGDSSFSDILTYTIPATAPNAPSNLSAPEWCMEYNVPLTWDDTASNEQAFAIERCRADIGLWEEIGTVLTDPQVLHPTITWTDTMVSTGTYNYRVKAKHPSGTSDYSNEIYVVVGIY